MIIVLAISWYIVGLLTFLTMAVFDNYEWKQIYYIWDKAKDVFLIWAIIRPAAFHNRLIVFPILIYAVVRLVWELISTFTGIAVNNEIVVAVLLIIVLAICTYLTVKGWFTQKR